MWLSVLGSGVKVSAEAWGGGGGVPTWEWLLCPGSAFPLLSYNLFVQVPCELSPSNKKILSLSPPIHLHIQMLLNLRWGYVHTNPL